MIVKLTENKLRRLIKEAIEKHLNENVGYNKISISNEELEKRYKNGEKLWEIFDNYITFDDCYLVYLNDKENFLTKKGKLLFDVWFDIIHPFYNGFALVEINNNFNFIDMNGNYLVSQWFDYARDFDDGYALVLKNEKFNFIDEWGDYLFEEGFDDADGFDYKGYAKVKKNGKYNWINLDGLYLSHQWFDEVEDFGFEKFAPVKLNDKWNYIGRNGRLLSDKWFDWVDQMYEGYGKVSINGKTCFIDTKGRYYKESDIYSWNAWKGISEYDYYHSKD